MESDKQEIEDCVGPQGKTHRIRQSASWYRLSGEMSQYISMRVARPCLGKSVVRNEHRTEIRELKLTKDFGCVISVKQIHDVQVEILL